MRRGSGVSWRRTVALSPTVLAWGNVLEPEPLRVSPISQAGINPIVGPAETTYTVHEGRRESYSYRQEAEERTT